MTKETTTNVSQTQKQGKLQEKAENNNKDKNNNR